MGVLRGLLVAGVIGLIAVAPCVICALLLSADKVAERLSRLARRLLPGTVRRRLDRVGEGPPWAPRWRLEPMPGGAESDRTDKGPPHRGDGRPGRTDKRPERGRRRRDGWLAKTRLGRRWRLSRLARELDDVGRAGQPRALGPPIEQVAGDLRRLNRLRGSVATRSRVWFVAVQEAYDEGLRVACAQLRIEEHLDGLAGMDLGLERLRVEGELQRAGLVLRDAGAQQR